MAAHARVRISSSLVDHISEELVSMAALSTLILFYYPLISEELVSMAVIRTIIHRRSIILPHFRRTS